MRTIASDAHRSSTPAPADEPDEPESVCRSVGARGGAVMADSQLIRCPSCGATNRVSQEAREKIGRGLAPVCGRCKTPLSADAKPVTVTDATFASEVERLAAAGSPRRVGGVVRAVPDAAPVIDELASQFVGRVRFAKLNSDENPETAARFNVRSLPTILVLKEGREVDRIIGLQPKTEIMHGSSGRPTDAAPSSRRERIPYAAMSETSSNCWKFSVINEASCWEYLVDKPSRTSGMAA